MLPVLIIGIVIVGVVSFVVALSQSIGTAHISLRRKPEHDSVETNVRERLGVEDGKVDGVPVRIQVFTADDGASSIQLAFDVDVGDLRVRTESSARAAGLTGDVRTGDERFDARFRIEGDAANAVSRLGRDARNDLLLLEQYRLSVTGGQLLVETTVGQVGSVRRRALAAVRSLSRADRTMAAALLDIARSDDSRDARLIATGWLESRFPDAPETAAARDAVANLRNAEAGQLSVSDSSGGEVSIAKPQGAVTLTKK